MSTFIHIFCRLVDILLFVLGFSLGEYGCVSCQKVPSSSKTLTPAPVCKKVWAVCLLVSSSTCSQGIVGLDKSQLFLSIARYGMRHPPPPFIYDSTLMAAVMATVSIALGWVTTPRS